jgi:hypothetical protein
LKLLEGVNNLKKALKTEEIIVRAFKEGLL